jgi:hypothetical protein
MSENCETFEELKSRFNPWWNTTESIELEYPGIENTRGWAVFKTEFDRVEAQEIRLRENARAHVWMASAELNFLRGLATFASGGRVLWLSQDLRSLDTEAAGKKLGNHVLELFSVAGWERLSECLEALKMEVKKNTPACNDYSSNIDEITSAFAVFIAREKKLPSKKQLNIEANRNKNRLNPSDYSWNDPLWENSEFSPYLKKAGFQKLPKASSSPSGGR